MRDYVSIVDVLRQRAQQEPERMLYTFLQDGEDPTDSFTYRQIDERARAIAARLQQSVKPGERALLLFPPGIEVMAALFGCLYAGVIAIPAPPPDVSAGKRILTRLQAIMTDARPAAVLTTGEHRAQLEVTYKESPEMEALEWVFTDQVDPSLMAVWHPVPRNSDDVAYLQYTSGSTSSPKGVMITYGNIHHQMEYMILWHVEGENQSMCTWMPYYHDFGLVLGLLEPIYYNIPCYVMSPMSFVRHPERWLQAIARFRCVYSGGPTFAYDYALRRADLLEGTDLDLSCWKTAYVSAEPVRPETVKKFIEAFGRFGFDGGALIPAYGLAEATLAVTVDQPGRPLVSIRVDPRSLMNGRVVEDDGPTAQTIISSGFLRADVRIAIVNTQTFTSCQSGEVGEIWVAGGSVSPGYWNRPEESEQIFRARLADGSGPYLRTGDLGFMKDGELFVAGRLKDMMIFQGQNIYPQDIEWTVQEVSPLLRAGYGVAFSIEEDGRERLVIAQEVEKAALKDEGLLEHLAKSIRKEVGKQHGLPVFAVALLKRGAITKTSSGKLQRYLVRNSYLDGSIEEQSHLIARTSLHEEAAPTNETEVTLVEIFESVLGVSPIGIRDNFFALGGDSLGFVQLNMLVEKRLGRGLPLDQPLEDLTVENIARLLTAQSAAEGGLAAPRPEMVEENQIRVSPGRRIASIFSRTDASLAQKLRLSLGVLKRQVARIGPDFVSYTLPYRPGTRFAAWFCRRGWAQRGIFRQRALLVRRTLELMGRQPDERLVWHNLYANFWRPWRQAALAQLPPEDFARLVSVTGLDQFQQAYRKGRGVILVHAHVAMGSIPFLVLSRQGVQDMMIVGEGNYPMELLGLRDYKFVADASDQSTSALTRFSYQLLQGRHILEKGGVLNIAVDGYQGKTGVEVNFLGRRRAFGTGFAELALATGAAVLPVFTSLDLDGSLKISFGAPLQPEGERHNQRIDSLVGQYVAVLEEMWRSDLANIRWRQLEQYLSLPPAQ